MQKVLLFLPMFLVCNAWADALTLDSAIESVRMACGGISDEVAHLKAMASAGTAMGAVSTVAGGIALGTGIAKAKTDNVIENAKDRWLQSRADIDENTGTILLKPDNLEEVISGIASSALQNKKQCASPNELSAEQKKSKLLGDIRTGTLAGATATHIAGTAIAGSNHINNDLESRISECVAQVKKLSNIYMQNRISANADTEKMNYAANILSNCNDWEYVDVDVINKRATGAAASSGVGIATGLAGTITSAIANSSKVAGKFDDKEKALNTTANVMAGGTTVAGVMATVFNATQIKVINRAADIAEKCEGAL